MLLVPKGWGPPAEAGITGAFSGETDASKESSTVRHAPKSEKEGEKGRGSSFVPHPPISCPSFALVESRQNPDEPGAWEMQPAATGP